MNKPEFDRGHAYLLHTTFHTPDLFTKLLPGKLWVKTSNSVIGRNASHYIISKCHPIYFSFYL